MKNITKQNQTVYVLSERIYKSVSMFLGYCVTSHVLWYLFVLQSDVGMIRIVFLYITYTYALDTRKNHNFKVDKTTLQQYSLMYEFNSDLQRTVRQLVEKNKRKKKEESDINALLHLSNVQFANFQVATNRMTPST